MNCIQVLQDLRFQVQLEINKLEDPDSGACWSIPEYPEGVVDGLQQTIDFIVGGTDVLVMQETHKALHEALKALQNKLNEEDE